MFVYQINLFLYIWLLEENITVDIESAMIINSELTIYWLINYCPLCIVSHEETSDYISGCYQLMAVL